MGLNLHNMLSSISLGYIEVVFLVVLFFFLEMCYNLVVLSNKVT